MKNLLRLLIVLLIVTVYSCKKDNETPAILPLPSFTQDRMIIEPGEAVAFTNTSGDAVSYSWDFGDNTAASTNQNTTHTYTSTGNFTVTLTATSETGDEALSTSNITVGNRWSIGAGIESISFVDSNDEPWDDDGTGPELLFGFAEADAQTFRPFTIGNDMLASDFPTGGTFAPENQVMFTNEDWAFIFVDDDEPFNDFNSIDLMGSFIVNPVTVTSTKNYEDGTGTFQFQSDGFSFLIAFEVRN